MPEPELAELINPTQPPAGCTTVHLRRGHNVDAVTLAARDVSDDSPDLTAEHRSRCDGAVRVLRFPTTGLNVPGEDRPVGVLVWCGEHGRIDQHFDGATPQERTWEWHLSTVV